MTDTDAEDLDAAQPIPALFEDVAPARARVLSPDVLAADAHTYRLMQRRAVVTLADALRDELTTGPDEPVPYWPSS